MASKVTSSNYQGFGSGTLMQAFQKLDRVSSKKDVALIVEAVSLQSAISRTLEDRGYIFDDDRDEWYYPLTSEGVAG